MEIHKDDLKLTGGMMIVSEAEVKRAIREELEAITDGYNMAGMEITELDLINETVAVKFKLCVVPEDKYIGLTTY